MRRLKLTPLLGDGNQPMNSITKYLEEYLFKTNPAVRGRKQLKNNEI